MTVLPVEGLCEDLQLRQGLHTRALSSAKDVSVELMAGRTAPGPSAVIAGEPFSMLDVSVRPRILDLLGRQFLRPRVHSTKRRAAAPEPSRRQRFTDAAPHCPHTQEMG